MQSQSASDQNAYVFFLIRTPMRAWLVTVALVLIVIGLAFSLTAWQEQDKHTFPGGMQKPQVNAF